jgi:hypothetical protein
MRRRSSSDVDGLAGTRLMADLSELLSALEAFADDAVIIREASGTPATSLSEKLDVLERVVELLRLHTGAMENRTKMGDVLARGVEVVPGTAGALRLMIGAPAAKADGRAWRAPEGRTQDEMQVPLLLYLLVTYRHPRRINDLLVDFLTEVRPWLSAYDVETTRTGVMRAMTTARSAARALRLHGLLTDSDRTAYKTWELSVLGLLVARLLVERVGAEPDMQSRWNASSSGGPFGASTHLSKPVDEALRTLSDPATVASAMQRIGSLRRDVFETFDRAVEIVAAFASRFAGEARLERREPHEARAEARAMIDALREAIPPDRLSAEMAEDVALKQLLTSL